MARAGSVDAQQRCETGGARNWAEALQLRPIWPVRRAVPTASRGRKRRTASGAALKKARVRHLEELAAACCR
jgi:hypothetical protein